jgi:hypothetical protein
MGHTFLKGLTGALAVSAALLGVALADAAAATARQSDHANRLPAAGHRVRELTPGQLRFDHRHGIVPLRGGGSTIPAVTASGGSPPCEVTCSAIHMSYFDGPVLSSGKVEGVFWGSGSYTSGAGLGGEMPAFYNAAGQSDWWAGLTEYNTTVAGGTNQFIGPVSSLGEKVIAPAAPNDGSTITDSQIQAELGAQLAANHLPSPTLDGTGNVETLYALYFPDNKVVCIDDAAMQCDTNAFCAYHSSFSYHGLDVPYMVLPAFTPGSADATGCGTLPTLTDDFTSAVSHELVEAATDTGVGLDTSANYAYPAAWGDNAVVNKVNVGEVMDACDAGSNADSSTLPGTGYYVQAIWSNTATACVFARSYLNLTPTVATIAAGGTQTYTATTDGATDVSASTTFTIAPATTGASCTGDVCTAVQPGHYTVHGTDGGLSSDTVQLTVTSLACAPGTYSATGNLPCTAAPPGHYVAVSGATSPTACTLGTYSPSAGATHCLRAPLNTYVNTVGAVSPIACPAHTFTLKTGSTSESACLYLAITTSTLPSGTLYSVGGVKYSTKLAAKGGARPYSWSLVSGKLPSGLKLDASTGVISGRATLTGRFTFTIKVRDTATASQPRRSAVATLSIRISR